MRSNLNRIIVLFVSIGFLALAIDIYAEHYQGLTQSKIMWIPIIFSLIAALSGFFITIIFNRFTYYYFTFLMFISAIVGSMGLYFHNKWRFEMLKKVFLKTEYFDFGVFVSMTPILAPLAFIALAMLGFTIAFFEPWGLNHRQQK